MSNTEFWVYSKFFNQKEINEINKHITKNYDGVEDVKIQHTI
jgi:hypothetical protein